MDYLYLQLRLEGKSVTGDDCLRQVEDVPGEDMPLVIVARLADGRVASYYDESLPRELYAGLKDRIGECEFPEHIVASINPDVKSLPSDHPLVQAFGFGAFAGNVHAIERGGGIVSACMSVRENRQCGEAWVYTDPQYRNQGFARQAVSAWAQNLLMAGKVPFYSHIITNIASANLAKRLGLQPVFEEISISYKNV